MKIKEKRPLEQYTARDLLSQWYMLYTEINKKDYSHTTHIGFELKTLKDLQNNYDVYLILISMQNYIKKGGRSIQYFAEVIDEYLPKTKYYKLIYLVSKMNDDNLKKELKELLALESKWLPASNDRKKMKEIEGKLYDATNQAEF